MRKTSIRQTVFTYFLGASLVIIAVYGIITYNLIRADLEQELEKRLYVSGSFIADIVQPADIPFIKIGGKVAETYREKLGTAAKKAGLNNIILLLPDGSKLLSLSDEGDFFLKLDKYEIQKAASGAAAASPMYRGAGGRQFKTAYIPAAGGKAIASLEASAVFVERLNQYRISFLVTSVIILFVAALISLLISLQLARPVKLLRHKAEEIAKRNFGEATEITGAEEIRILGSVLDDMKTELASYIAEREKMATVGEFSAGVAHEIRNSLASVSGYAELIRERSTDEKIKKQAGDIVKNVMRMSGFLNSFLEFTKNFSPDFTETELSKLLYEAVLETGDDTAIKVSCPEKITVKADPYLMKRALHNLLLNALQALDKPEKEILLSAAVEEGKAVIRVKDNGCGMSEEMRSKIFHPFVSGKKSGTGLGLAITYRIITEIHGGTIDVSSEEGEGTEMTIRLSA